MSFSKLPNELIVLIFNQFNDLNELLKFRLINKRCNELVKNMKINKLAIESKFMNKQNYLKKFFSFSNEPICSSVLFRNGTLTTNDFDFMNLNLMNLILNKLKQLSIDRLFINLKTRMSNFESLINRFEELEHLQINCFKTIQKKQIKFDGLKILSILKYSGGKLIVEAPKLTKLAWFANWDKLELIHKHTITHLSVNYIAIDSLSTEFENIQYLDCKDFVDDYVFEHQMSFLKLKKLNLRTVKFKENAINLLTKLQLSTDLQLFYYGIEIKDLNDIDALFGYDNMILEIGTQFVINNHQNISNEFKINESVEIDFNKLINHFNRSQISSYELCSKLIDHFNRSQIPCYELCSKFTNIRRVSDGENVLNNQTEFIQFLRACYKSLDELNILKTPFNQPFYDDLHLNCPFIKCLKINCPNGSVEDYHFLLKLNELTRLDLRRELDLNTIKLLIDKFRDLNFKFLLNNKMMSVDLIDHEIKYSGSQYSNFSTKCKILNFIQTFFNHNLEIDLFRMKL